MPAAVACNVVATAVSEPVVLRNERRDESDETMMKLSGQDNGERIIIGVMSVKLLVEKTFLYQWSFIKQVGCGILFLFLEQNSGDNPGRSRSEVKLIVLLSTIVM